MEKEPDNFGLRTPYTAGFTPKTQEHPQENLTEKVLIIHCLLNKAVWGLTKVRFSDITDVVPKKT